MNVTSLSQSRFKGTLKGGREGTLGTRLLVFRCCHYVHQHGRHALSFNGQSRTQSPQALWPAVGRLHMLHTVKAL